MSYLSAPASKHVLLEWAHGMEGPCTAQPGVFLRVFPDGNLSPGSWIVPDGEVFLALDVDWGVRAIGADKGESIALRLISVFPDGTDRDVCFLSAQIDAHSWAGGNHTFTAGMLFNGDSQLCIDHDYFGKDEIELGEVLVKVRGYLIPA